MATQRSLESWHAKRISLVLLTLPVLIGCGNAGSNAPAPPLEERLTIVGNEGETAVASATSPTTRQAQTRPQRKPAAPSSSVTERLGACHQQDGKAVPPTHLRAIGTEPFWGARIEGRCVTYSHPEDQSGMRIWTRFAGTAQSGQWRGAYQGKPFVLRTRLQADCSDGMSDRRYPIAVTLIVSAEERQGCADRV